MKENKLAPCPEPPSRKARVYVQDPWKYNRPVVKPKWEELLEGLGVSEGFALEMLDSNNPLKDNLVTKKLKEWIEINFRRVFVPENALKSLGLYIKE